MQREKFNKFLIICLINLTKQFLDSKTFISRILLIIYTQLIQNKYPIYFLALISFFVPLKLSKAETTLKDLEYCLINQKDYECTVLLNITKPIHDLPILKDQGPIPIKVIPYSRSKKTTRNSIRSNNKIRNSFNIDDDSYLYELR